MISPTTLNAVRFAFNRTDISRTSTDFFSAPEVGINIYSYMPHYMLLTVGPRRTDRLSARRRHRKPVEVHHQRLAGQRRRDAGARRPPVRARRERGALDLAVAGQRPFARAVDHRRHADRRRGHQHRLSDFLLGRLGTNALMQAAPNTLDMAQTYLGRLRAGHVASRARG